MAQRTCCRAPAGAASGAHPKRSRNVVAFGERRSANRTRWNQFQFDKGAFEDVCLETRWGEWVFTAASQLADEFAVVDQLTANNARRVQQAMRKQSIGPHHFAGSTGYGHGDLGRHAFDMVMAEVMGTEACMARIQIMSAAHALACALMGVLRPGQHLLVASDDMNYETGLLLDGQVGSLSEWGVSSSQCALTDTGTLDQAVIVASAEKLQPAVLLIQRGAAIGEQDAGTNAACRPLVSVCLLQQIIQAVKLVSPDTLVVVDNQNAEFMESTEPGVAGADLVTGSLLGALGGSITSEGGYVAGSEDLVQRACARLSAPGLSLDAGSVPGDTQRLTFQGLFFGPGMLGESLKGSILACEVLTEMGYLVRTCGAMSDTSVGAAIDGASQSSVTTVDMRSEAAAAALVSAVQASSCVSASRPRKSVNRRGHTVLSGGGGFVSGSTANMGAIAVMTPPYTVHLYGGTHWSHWANALALAGGALL